MASRALAVGTPYDHELPALEIRPRQWQAWLTRSISAALLITVVLRLQNFGFAASIAALPRSFGFWLAFAAYYLSLPFSEWLIFRRLWRLPAKGIAALLRKLVSNEILLGYSGEAYFYAWARQHAKLVATPFGAIKDVSILSALAGNLITIVMLAISWPLVNDLAPALHGQTIAASSAFVLGVSFVILAFRNRLFSLESSALRFIFSIHIARLLVTTILAGIMWHLAMPGVPLLWLVILATLQLLVSRLPFVPSKDLVFASLAVFLIGNSSTVSIVVTMIATAIVMTHLVLGALLILPEFVRKEEI